MAEEAHAVVYPASEVGSVWPVPTWNLRTQCQSLQAAGVKLPAGLSASLREGATRIAMMGDQSQSKREDEEHVGGSLLADLLGNGEVGTVELVRQTARRAVRLAIPERGIADARQLVRHRAGRLVVIGALLHRQAPGSQAIECLAGRSGQTGRAQHRPRPVSEQHAQVAIPLLGNPAEHPAVARTELTRCQPEPAGEVARILEVAHRAACAQWWAEPQASMTTSDTSRFGNQRSN